MEWTQEQLAAITLRDKNILVAAAAGSGKTAVLVERIKRLVLEERCPIDRMLIVTFTNAAAAEMREKIYRAIQAAATEMTSDPSTLAFLREQLNLLPQANISTFHAFALEIIRRYFYLIDVEPNFKICDEAQQVILRGEAMDELLEEQFAAGGETFTRFLNAYSGDRNEDRLREMLNKVYDTIQSLPEPEIWLHEKVQELAAGKLEGTAIMDTLWEIACDGIHGAAQSLRRNRDLMMRKGLAAAAELAERDIATVQKLAENLPRPSGKVDAAASAQGDQTAQGSYAALQDALATFKLETMGRTLFKAQNYPELDGEELATCKKRFTDNRDAAKKQIKALQKDFFSARTEDLQTEMQATADDAAFLEGLILRYGELYQQKKRERNLVDFSDIEHYAYAILKDEEASRFYREKFFHIFVDEYQDSNLMQEALIERICRPNNLFLVGDVKQSIYKFRLAEPEIFQRRYRQYADGKESASCKIDLNRNFRSKAPILDFVNTVSGAVMRDYDENAALYLGDVYGNKFYDKPKLYLTEVPWREEDELDDEIKHMKKAEKEALAAAALIRRSLGEPIFDSKAGVERPLTLRDIVILMRGVRGYGDIFYQVLQENHIPGYVDDNDGYFDTLEINAFLSLLQIIDNEKQDIPLLTALRSEFFGFSVEELAAVRIACKEGSYYAAFAACAAADSASAGCAEAQGVPAAMAAPERQEMEAIFPPALSAKCAAALEKLRHWQELAMFMPLEELVWKLMLDSGFYLAMGALPGGLQRQANLRALVDKALAFRQGQGGSLYGFIRYISILKERKVATGQVKLVGEQDELVKIMTIHKSKGLEFPMVILAGFCRKLNYTSVGKSVLVHKDLGLAFPIVDYAHSWYRTTTLQKLIREKFRREEVEEEQRVLYVALTRAKDRLAILGIADEARTAADRVMTEAPKDTSYFTMTGGVICEQPDGLEILEEGLLRDLAGIRRRQDNWALEIFDAIPAAAADGQVDRQLRYVYDDAGELTIKSKYSVSELNAWQNQQAEGRPEPLASAATDQRESTEEGQAQINLPEPASFKAGQTFTAAQRGTIYHCVLEHLDFAAVRAEGRLAVEKTIQRLVEDKFLTAEESGIIATENLVGIAGSDLGRRIAESGQVRREQPFNLRLVGGPAEIPGAVKAGSQTIVQGVIDLYFAEKDGLVLVDYKTSRLHSRAGTAAMEAEKKRIAEHYRTQIALYRRALEAATEMPVKAAYICLTDCGEIVAM